MSVDTVFTIKFVKLKFPNRKYMKKWMYFALIVLFVACKNDSSKSSVDTSEFRSHVSNEHFKVLTPDFMKQGRGLNPDASLQLENREKETYLAVIEEAKSDVERNLKMSGVYNDDLSAVGNYLNVQLNGFTNGLTVVEKSDPKTLEINGMPAFQVELVAKPQSVSTEIFYLLTFLEGKERLYMCLQWTLAGKRAEFNEIFYAVAQSFEELP